VLQPTSNKSHRKMSFSAWVVNATIFGHGLLASWFAITIVVALIKMSWRIFMFFPWWVFIASTAYLAMVATRNKWQSAFSAISKVYAPFVVLIYWAAIYPDHNPWHDPTDTYLVVMAHIVCPAIMLIETFRSRNTHYAQFRQRNPDFPVIHSFWINTVVYFLYLGVYLLVLPKFHDPIYTNVGFTIDEGRDALLAFLGWIVVMAVNSLLAMITWYWRERERAITAKNFEMASKKPNEHIAAYVFDNTTVIVHQ
jgi:hypothetical protein